MIASSPSSPSPSTRRPMPDRRRRRRLVGACAPMLILDRRRAAAARRSTRCSAPQAAASRLYALFTTIVAAGAIAFAVPLWHRVQDADRGPFSTLGQARRRRRLLGLRHRHDLPSRSILAALLADGYLRREGLEGAEPYVLMLLSASGGVIMASANDLIVMFLGLEILSIAVYVLAAMHLRKVTSQEAGMKYFVLGAFSLGLLPLRHRPRSTAPPAPPTSSTIIDVPRRPPCSPTTACCWPASPCCWSGFGFKVAAVPFHFWTPDVYQGAPSPSVACMASGVKAAGFAGLLRVFVAGLRHLPRRLAADRLRRSPSLTLVVGLGARRRADRREADAGLQLDQPRRLHPRGGAGGHRRRASQAALFYLAAYTFMVAGSFGIVTVVGRKGDVGTQPRRLPGPGRAPAGAGPRLHRVPARPGRRAAHSGFFAKFYVIAAAVEAGSTWLAIIAMLTAVVAAFLYLRIIVSMYMSVEEAGEPRTIRGARSPPARLAVCCRHVASASPGLLRSPGRHPGLVWPVARRRGRCRRPHGSASRIGPA